MTYRRVEVGTILEGSLLMKKLNLLYVFIFLIGCVENSSTYSPEPQDLLEDSAYKEQIEKIDEQRLEFDQESFKELLENNRVTKEDNGTTPVLVVVEKPDPKETEKLGPQLDKNGDEVITPVHNKQEVEEYFIKKEEVPGQINEKPGKVIEETDKEKTDDDVSENKIVLDGEPDVNLDGKLNEDKKIDSETKDDEPVNIDTSGEEKEPPVLVDVSGNKDKDKEGMEPPSSSKKEPMKEPKKTSL